ncbi:MAG: DUF4358 domain-containing protein [Oscillospiraceae bacterium]|jgi:hypothetical protein|nr:DUF4358 domain-containing protein [Oscillospiraceae bacterium]
MKKIICVVLCTLMVASLVACAGTGNGGGGGASQTNLTGTTDGILTKIVDGVAEAGVETPFVMPPLQVMADSSEFDIGLSTDDFNRLVDDAYSSIAAISTFAHQISVIKANSAADATEIMSIISSNGGFDPNKWICVWPQNASVIRSGEYVLLAASRNDIVEAAIDTFTTQAGAGNVSSVNRFWEHEGGEWEGGDDGGIGILPAPIVP